MMRYVGWRINDKRHGMTVQTRSHGGTLAHLGGGFWCF
jgi:hypothetical protein